ncbi:hypothetical protein, partial [Candidatus Bandiella numerosa]|uniref:hypothetical protein n=1 Tax=Candidatus Bandiella numerosa TaxID=2570586 RepID=UPI001F1A36DF
MRHRLYGGVRGRCCNAPLYSIEAALSIFLSGTLLDSNSFISSSSLLIASCGLPCHTLYFEES